MFEAFALSLPREDGSENEDSCYMDAGSGLFIVADGVGGNLGGAVASRLSVETFSREIAAAPLDEGKMRAILEQAVDRTNKKVRERAAQDSLMKQMGSTLLAAVWFAERGYLAHIGDSRAYLFDRNRLQQLTRDHTVAQELMDKDMLTASEGVNHPMKHVLARCIGMGDSVMPDIIEFSLSPGDWLILASDGLEKALPLDRMEQILAHHSGGAEYLCYKMITEARKKGLEDDTTVLVMRIEESPGNTN